MTEAMTEPLKRAVIETKPIPTLKIRPNPWNPNEQTQEQQKALSQDIKEDGYDQALILVAMWGPLPPLPEETGWKDFNWKTVTHLPPEGKDENSPDWYRIISGEHRWRILREQGYQIIDCIVKPPRQWDELQQKIKTVRKNILHGELLDSKFTKLVNDLVANDQQDLEILSAQFGFNKYQDFYRHYEQEQTVQESEIRTLVDEAEKADISGIDSLTAVINALVTNFSSTLPGDFMHFIYKRRVHLMAVMDEDASKAVGALVTYLKGQGHGEFKDGVPLTEAKSVLSINEFLTAAINAELEKRNGEIPQGPRVPTKDGLQGGQLPKALVASKSPKIAPELEDETEDSTGQNIQDGDIFNDPTIDDDDEDIGGDEDGADYVGGEGEEDLDEELAGV